MYQLITAINNRDYASVRSLLSNNRYDVNFRYEYLSFYGDENKIPLPTVAHRIVSTNYPKLLQYIIDKHGAEIRSLNEIQSLYKVLLNREFDGDVKVRSAISNLRILFENAAPIPQGIIDQLFVRYMLESAKPNNDNQKILRENLKSIIREIYRLVAFEQFLRHIQNNRRLEAIKYIESDISDLYPGLKQHNITGKIDPNYDADMRGSAVLTAAELGNKSTYMFDGLIKAKTKVDLNFRDKQGMNAVYKLAMRGDLTTLNWILSKLNDAHRFELLTLQVRDQQAQKKTPFQIATMAAIGQPDGPRTRVINVLRNAINSYADYVLETIVVHQSPDELLKVVDAGYNFEEKHSSNQSNVLHFAAKSNVHANIRFIWRHLQNAKKLDYLVARNEDLDTPLQVAQRKSNAHMVRIINELANKLVQEVEENAHYVKERLVNAGYSIVNPNIEEVEVRNQSQQSHNQNTLVLESGSNSPQENVDNDESKRVRLTNRNF